MPKLACWSGCRHCVCRTGCMATIVNPSPFKAAAYISVSAPWPIVSLGQGAKGCLVWLAAYFLMQPDCSNMQTSISGMLPTCLSRSRSGKVRKTCSMDVQLHAQQQHLDLPNSLEPGAAPELAET